MDIIKKYKELLIIGLVIIGFAFYWYGLKPSQEPSQEPSQSEIRNARVATPQNLKEGQCVIQVLGVKGELFNEMKNKCRVLVVLNEQGLITEIIEKEE